MALAKVYSVALLGVAGHIVEVEADIADGVPAFNLLGLPDAALSESRDRVRSALINSGEAWPNKRTTVALSPASLPKRGSGFDLSVALALLAGEMKISSEGLHDTVVLGELSLDGRVRAIAGALPAMVVARDAGFTRAIVPRVNMAEASLIPGIEVFGFSQLINVVAFLRGLEFHEDDEIESIESPHAAPDLADVLGQYEARRAIEIAAVGEHHLLMMGTPGAGKTMLAERLPSIMPPLDTDAAIEVTSIHSIAGLVKGSAPLIRTPPFVAPHHTATRSAIIGGGMNQPRPGAISLAHRGVLFLDEAPEFISGVLDALREPLESGVVSLARTGGSALFPARFLLVLAANPCPCGRFTGDGRACNCTPLAIRRYLSKLSGPLLDRVDLQIFVEPVSRVALAASDVGEVSAVVRERVLVARERTSARLAGSGFATNAHVSGSALRREFAASDDAMALIHRELEHHRVTARGLHKVLRVAWSIADLAGHDRPRREDVAEAYLLRSGISQLVGAA
ncbi:unannotated protein [freshwater metagenome]|uniref:Unannotated protein n=1 Tax=freshwater metagenome TaxID=449393 RepID=A0A6J7BI93_9ZZZZ|nr:YifB family Mg chelatase-like AAA ATPase [Actinomycetota bacterium]MSY52148.1 YifB family Mg chelatase-like AAA ATPase [Actinomycetota bacterium]